MSALARIPAKALSCQPARPTTNRTGVFARARCTAEMPARGSGGAFDCVRKRWQRAHRLNRPRFHGRRSGPALAVPAFPWWPVLSTIH
jgi:hypothetical protein